MPSPQITFHGDDDDLAALFALWFGRGDLLISQALGGLDQAIVSGTSPGFAMRQLARPGDVSRPAWVIGPVVRPLVYDTLQMKDGSGSKLRIALNNRFVVGLRFGGRTGPAELQPSVLSSSEGDAESLALFKHLKKAVTQRGRYVGSCWLLPGAYAKLANGWRLPRGQFHGPTTDIPSRSW